MAWYDTGTVTVTNGSATVTGSSTAFLTAKVQIGEAFYGPDDNLYEIAAIVSETQLTLADNYLGSTQSGQAYKIIPTQSLVADLAEDVTTLISDFADVRDIVGEGKFQDGSVSAPAITFNTDQDNGLYRIGANNWALAGGGLKQIELTATEVDLNYAGSTKLTTKVGGVDVTGVLTVSSDVSIADKIIHTGDTNTAIRFPAADTVRIETNGSTRLNISSGGDLSLYEDTGSTAKLFWDASAESLGIGTTSPASELDVSAAEAPTITLTSLDFSLAANDFIGSLEFRKVDASGGGSGVTASVNCLTTDLGGATALSFHTGSASGNNIEAMRIDSSGNLLVGTTTSPSDTGTIVADGVYLGGTGAANYLDDYEEGTFTVTLSDEATTTGNLGSAGTITGKYVKIGKLVTIVLNIASIDTTGMTGTNLLYIKGLPFTSLTDQNTFASVRTASITFSGVPYLLFGTNRSYAYLTDSISGTGFTGIIINAYTSGSATMDMEFSYYTNA